MKIHPSFFLFAIVECMVVAYILCTVGELPKNIASHFNAAGMPNGFMSQQFYIKFMLGFSVGIPLLIVLSFMGALQASSSSLNIPNKAYWLSEENINETKQSLNNFAAILGIFITAFSGYIHWLLLQANKAQPPQLSGNLLVAGLGVFITFTLFWSILLVVKFKRVPE